MTWQNCTDYLKIQKLQRETFCIQPTMSEFLTPAPASTLNHVTSPVSENLNQATPMSGVSFRSAKTNIQGLEKLSEVTSSSSLLRTSLSVRSGLQFPVGRFAFTFFNKFRSGLLVQVAPQDEAGTLLQKSWERCAGVYMANMT